MYACSQLFFMVETSDNVLGELCLIDPRPHTMELVMLIPWLLLCLKLSEFHYG